MGAEHIVHRDTGEDEMHLAGVVIKVSSDDAGVAIVAVSHAPDGYVELWHNNERVLDAGPDPEAREALVAAQAAQEAARSTEDRLAEAIAARAPSDATPAQLATIAAEEMTKLLTASAQ